jgi:DNA primase
MLNLKSIDIRQYLEHKGITYKTEGKNVTAGWAEVPCPFCINDPSEHLGINLDSNSINCWKCGTTGTIFKYVMKIEKCSFKRSESLLKPFTYTDIPPEQIERAGEANRSIDFDFTLPVEAAISPLPMHTTYLEGRRFDLVTIQETYKIRFCGHTGMYAYRIIIPIFLRNKLVAFTSRGVSDDMAPKYKSSPNTESIIPIKDCLYNIDTVKQTALVVEGPLDVWRVGDGCICTFGTKFTKRQIAQIKEIKRVFVMFDDGAQKEASNLANELALFTEVEVIELNQGDPCDMSEGEVLRLRKEIFGKIY